MAGHQTGQHDVLDPEASQGLVGLHDVEDVAAVFGDDGLPARLETIGESGIRMIGIGPVVPRFRGQVPGADHRPAEVDQQAPDLPSQMRRPRVVGEGENPLLPVDFEQCTSHDHTR